LKNLEDAKSKEKTYAKPVVKEKEGTKDLMAALKASLEKTKRE
jgi:non-homologous end joining protein Ku